MKSRLYDKTGPIAFPTIGKTQVLSPNAGDRPDNLWLGAVEVGNSSGAAAACGWGFEIPDAMWKAGFWDDSADPAYIDDTTDAQDVGTGDMPVGTVSTNDDGLVIQALDKFNVVCIDIGTGANNGTLAYTFWDGSAWTTLPTITVPTWTGTGDQYLVFMAPATWTRLASTDVPVSTDGLSANYYAIKIVWSTAPSATRAIIDEITVVRLLDYVESVADGASIVFNAQGEIPILYKARIVPYCATANAANWVNIEYRMGA